MKFIDRIWESDLFAHYNESTGEIKAKGKWAKLHEEGHSKQPKKLIYLVCIWTQAFTIFVGVGAFVKVDLTLILLAGIPTILLYYLELDAWIYAFRNRKNEIH